MVESIAYMCAASKTFRFRLERPFPLRAKHSACGERSRKQDLTKPNERASKMPRQRFCYVPRQPRGTKKNPQRLDLEPTKKQTFGWPRPFYF